MPANQQTSRQPEFQKKRRRFQSSSIFFIVGAAAIVAATAIWLFNEYDNKRAAENSRQTAQTLMDIILAGDPSNIASGEGGSGGPGEGVSGAGDVPDGDFPDSGVPGGNLAYVVVGEEAYIGVLSIPRFSLNLPVNLTWSYPKLRMSPCRYSGDIGNNDLVIAAHSYRSHFGNINSLSYGDEVIFTDTSGVEYRFYVALVDTAKPSETRAVVSSQYHLTLFTCTYDSRARVVARCFLADVQ